MPEDEDDCEEAPPLRGGSAAEPPESGDLVSDLKVGYSCVGRQRCVSPSITVTVSGGWGGGAGIALTAGLCLLACLASATARNPRHFSTRRTPGRRSTTATTPAAKPQQRIRRSPRLAPKSHRPSLCTTSGHSHAATVRPPAPFTLITCIGTTPTMPKEAPRPSRRSAAAARRASASPRLARRADRTAPPPVETVFFTKLCGPTQGPNEVVILPFSSKVKGRPIFHAPSSADVRCHNGYVSYIVNQWSKARSRPQKGSPEVFAQPYSAAESEVLSRRRLVRRRPVSALTMLSRMAAEGCAVKTWPAHGGSSCTQGLRPTGDGADARSEQPRRSASACFGGGGGAAAPPSMGGGFRQHAGRSSGLRAQYLAARHAARMAAGVNDAGFNPAAPPPPRPATPKPPASAPLASSRSPRVPQRPRPASARTPSQQRLSSASTVTRVETRTYRVEHHAAPDRIGTEEHLVVEEAFSGDFPADTAGGRGPAAEAGEDGAEPAAGEGAAALQRRLSGAARALAPAIYRLMRDARAAGEAPEEGCTRPSDSMSRLRNRTASAVARSLAAGANLWAGGKDSYGKPLPERLLRLIQETPQLRTALDSLNPPVEVVDDASPDQPSVPSSALVHQLSNELVARVEASKQQPPPPSSLCYNSSSAYYGQRRTSVEV
ncbi:hypothetical protein DIPPA_10906 [Diplonema papillatum]|nr:hypothetical protein DIPPA_10906 [Diplonema papillatum]